MNDKLVAGADPYYYPGINVLKNRLEIREAHRLLQAEQEFTALRAAIMPLGPSAMGLPHLCAVHLALFQDIYPWAGHFREIDIYKDDTQFCHFGYIEKEGNALMQELEEEEFLVGLPLDKFAERLGHYYTGLNLLHPFREGNGRALRIFIEQLVIHAGYDIEWAKVDRDRWLAANKTAVFGDETDLVAIFNDVVSEIHDEH
ncbi:MULTISPECIES: putative adenosine monophosphate-protein transferase Fic [Rahnella]|jgi:cell filamentation protein|uniref:protein adenylyltransferase n=1 Tax=Rahnella victoriana TaxID=1510570 RepID=A0ABS0DX40_9GAMM|nr:MULTISPECIES: putative adenosine monophosphate-protein transferase Fic [Rahnella]VTQ56776.1 cell filamentation protein [Campylobacter jejuni]MBF7957249.1 putative adenosine monophosphate-protein transferase Fic [Rahnella victoriana]TBX33173.1 putative adenosine monophosphate-protein transferase Fic [Rahnella victoriana]TDS93267.1 cell filamentation protein [Rahnella sp. BIGb0236]UHM92484.1 putative adenosine monophosphate-protein transferase Fic [Rahnella victoriana]